jgi:hypothetical protein
MGKAVIVRRNSLTMTDKMFTMEDVSLPEYGFVTVPVMKGDFTVLPRRVQEYIAEHVRFS